MSKRFDLASNRFNWDRRLLALTALAALALAMRGWLAENPQHNPWAPLDLRDPAGWATSGKLSGLRDDPAACREVLERSEVTFVALPATGEGACLRADRTVLAESPLSPVKPAMTCSMAAGMNLWLDQEVRPSAQSLFGSQVVRVEHYGTFNCRRINGGDSGRWSEHATGNAIDVAAFALENGQRITVAGGWESEGDESAFLKSARNGACDIFGTVLSPDYNAAHRDHFHLDQQSRGFGGLCR